MPELTPSAPWERQPGEPEKAFAAFAAYRDLGPKRSLDAVGRQLYGGTQTGRKRDATGRLQEWSRTWQWVERAAAWDGELDRLARLEQVEAVKDMCRRHAEQAQEFQAKALERLAGMTLEEMSVGETLRYFVEAVKIERLARGEPEQVLEQRGQEKSADEQRHLTAAVLRDPVAAALACQLFERVAAGQRGPAGPADAGGPGLARQPEEVAAGAPPEPAQPQAGGRGDGAVPPPDDHHAAPPRQEHADQPVFPGVVPGELPGPPGDPQQL
jgi:hypothetical protein